MNSGTPVIARSPDELGSPPVIARSPDELGTTKQSQPQSQSQSSILITSPLSYLDFLKLEMYAKFVMTDSGGIQEETTVLNVPCLTLRDTTERPITITQGTNVLVGNDPRKIIEEASKILAFQSPSTVVARSPDELGRPPVVARSPDAIGTTKQSQPQFKSRIELWDGMTAERIVDIIVGREYNDIEEGGIN